MLLLLQTTIPAGGETTATSAETTAAGGTTVTLDPGQVQQLAELSQGNTYALLGILFVACMLLSMIYLNTLLR